MPLTNKQKKRIWIGILIAGFLLELLMIGVASASLMRGVNEISYLQSVVFLAIGVWIYIAYLKQRSLDISKHVVDEKVKTHALLDALKDGVILLDPDCRVLVFNGHAARVTGLSDLDLLSKDIRGELDPAAAEFLAGNREGDFDTVVKSTQRKIRVSVLNLPIVSDEGKYRLMYTYECVEVKAAPEPEEGRGADAVSEKLLRDLAEYTVATAGNQESDADRAKAAALGLRARSRLNVLDAGSIVDRIAANQLKDSVKPVNLDVYKVIEGIIDGITSLVKAGTVQLKLPDQPAEGFAVNGDPALLEPALRQIIYNAVLESVPGGEVSVRFAEMGSNMGIMVHDNGPAVSKENMSDLFLADYNGVKLDDGTLVRDGGQGYHLARGVIEAHGGTLVAEVGAQSGLAVTLMLPGA